MRTDPSTVAGSYKNTRCLRGHRVIAYQFDNGLPCLLPQGRLRTFLHASSAAPANQHPYTTQRQQAHRRRLGQERDVGLGCEVHQKITNLRIRRPGHVNDGSGGGREFGGQTPAGCPAGYGEAASSRQNMLLTNNRKGEYVLYNVETVDGGPCKSVPLESVMVIVPPVKLPIAIPPADVSLASVVTSLK